MITITGSEGFIGKNLCNTADLYNRSELVDLKNGKDILEMTKVGDVVVHLAAVSSIPKSFYNPTETMRTNMQGLSHIINLCQKNNSHLIFTSSCSVVDPQSPYSYSKLWGEKLIEMSGISYTILRLGNVYGEGDDKSAIMHFLDNDEITIFGDGSIKRNFVCVDDVANIIAGIIRIADTSTTGIIKGIFSVGSENLTIKEVAEMFEKPIKYAEPRKGDSQDLSFAPDFLGCKKLKDWLK